MSESSPEVSVVLPTYQEAASLPVIVPRIAAALSEAGIAHEIIVVDDDSPDGTAEIAAGLAPQYPVRVLHRKAERGLATAVLRGFAMARAPVCAVMDADGSHPVSALPEMVRLIAQDKADIVVGSRHVRGGGSRNWPLFSQLKSKLAASLTFGITSMTDPTTGLMAVRTSLLPGLVLDPVGWKIVLEVVVKSAPARVAEVPIVFEDRELGESKQSLRVFAQYARHVARLYSFRYPALAELVKFCVVGLFGLFVDLSTVTLVKELWQLDTRLCAVIGFMVAVSTNYALNRRFTFRHGRELPALWSYLTYVGANLTGLSVRMLVVQGMIVLADLDRGGGYLISNAAGIALATLFNFFGAKFLAFDPQRLSAIEPDDAPARAERVSTLPPPEPALGRRVAIPAFLLLIAALGSTAAHSLRQLDPATDDEGVNITMALNMRESFELALRPSVVPNGRRDWVREDLPALGNTPLFPGLLAAASALGDLRGMRVVPWLALWITILCSALTLRRDSPRASVYAALLLASSPAFLSHALSLEFEPVLTAFCAAGLLLFCRGIRARRPMLAAWGGLLLGLGFATKMWLIVPYALAACAYVLVQTTLVRARDPEPLALRRSTGAASLAFAIGACSHLLFVALLAPSDLSHWIGSVYLGIFSGHGVTGGKLSALGGYHAAPAWYYPAILYRDHFFLLPLVLFGLPSLVRRNRGYALCVLAMCFGACLGVVVLSVPAVKEPLYVLAAVPSLYLLAATCLVELEHDDRRYLPANRATVNAAIALALLGMAAVWVARASGEQHASTGYAVMHSAGTLAVALCGALWLSRRQLAPALLLACAVALLAWTGSVDNTRHAERAIAGALAPQLRGADPAYPSFVAPRSRLLMGMLRRAGTDVGSDERCSLAGDAAIRAWVLGPEQLARPSCAAHAEALARSERELPPPPEASAYRLFVRSAPRP